MIVPPGFSTPRRSASSIIASAMRSLIEPPGLARSDLIHTSRVAEQAVDADVRRVADGLEDVGGFHAGYSSITAGRKEIRSKAADSYGRDAAE